LAGCSGESFASILHSLGYQPERRKGSAVTKTAPAPSKGSLHGGGEGDKAGCASDALPQGDESRDGDSARPARDPPRESSESITPQDGSCSVSAPPEAAVEGLEADKAKAEGPLAAIIDGENLIEIWRPHRRRHQARKPEVRAHKRHFGIGEAPLIVTATKTPGAGRASFPKATADVLPDGKEISVAAISDSPSRSAQASLDEQGRKIVAKRATDERLPRSEVRPTGRMPPRSENRGSAAERGERLSERLGTRDGKMRPKERLPDLDSPF